MINKLVILKSILWYNIDDRIVDNFYQTSSFFPMPLCLIGTLYEKGE